MVGWREEGKQSIWEFPILSTQFFCEPRVALKNSLLIKKECPKKERVIVRINELI